MIKPEIQREGISRHLVESPTKEAPNPPSSTGLRCILATIEADQDWALGNFCKGPQCESPMLLGPEMRETFPTKYRTIKLAQAVKGGCCSSRCRGNNWGKSS